MKKTPAQFILLVALGTMLSLALLLPHFRSQAQVSGWPTVVRWSEAGDRIAIGYGDGRIEIWDAGSQQLVRTLAGHHYVVDGLAWHPDGVQLISGGSDRTVNVWNTTTGENLWSHGNYPQDVFVVEWNPDGSRMIAMTTDGYMPVYDSTTTERLFYRQAEAGSPLIMAWSPDNSQIAVGTNTGRVEILDGQTLEHEALLGELPVGPAACSVLELAWSPDSTLVAGGRWDGTIYVWEVATGQLKYDPLVANPEAGVDLETSLVKAVAFSPDGRVLQSVSQDGTIRRWNAQTGEVLDTIQMTAHVYAASFSPDGTQLAYGGADITLHFVDVPPLVSSTP